MVRQIHPLAKIPGDPMAETALNAIQSTGFSGTMGTAVPDGLRPGWLSRQDRRTNRTIHKESNDGSEQQ